MSKLNKSQLFYLEQNADKPIEELAQDMGVSVSRVTTAMNRLKKDRAVLAAAQKTEPEPPPPKPKKKRADPVVMTDSMSHLYDEQAKRAVMPPKLAESISIIDPNARIY